MVELGSDLIELGQQLIGRVAAAASLPGAWLVDVGRCGLLLLVAASAAAATGDGIVAGDGLLGRLGREGI